MNALKKLIDRCNEMDITEQLNWLGDASMSYQAMLELARLQRIEQAAIKLQSRLDDLYGGVSRSYDWKEQEELRAALDEALKGETK